MNEDCLLSAFGEIDDCLISNALHTGKKRNKHAIWIGIAACVCLALLGTAYRLLYVSHQSTIHEMSPAGQQIEEDVFLDRTAANEGYFGPILPLLCNNSSNNIVAAREITFDFAPYGAKEALRETFANDRIADFMRIPTLGTSVLVSDTYSFDGTCASGNYIYPFISSYSSLSWSMPQLFVNGISIDGALVPGTKTSTYDTISADTELFPESLNDLDQHELSTTNVVTFSFPDVIYDNVFIHFSYNENSDVKQLTSYVNQRCVNSENQEVWYNIEGSHTEISFTNLTSEEISYQIVRIDHADSDHPSFGEPITDFKVITTSQSLYHYCVSFVKSKWDTLNHNEGLSDAVLPEMIAESMFQDGLDRFSGDINESLGETVNGLRLFYITIPANVIPQDKLVSLTAKSIKDGSYNMYGASRGETYDMLTTIPHCMNITELSAVISTHHAVQIAKENYGFHAENGDDKVILDPNETMYYLEVIKSS